MEINNSPSISLIPVILGDKNALQTNRPVERIDAVGTGSSAEASSLNYSRVITEAEKQAARQQLQRDEDGQNNQSNLSRDGASSGDGRAINAYLETQQADQKNYLSDVLGIDVYIWFFVTAVTRNLLWLLHIFLLVKVLYP